MADDQEDRMPEVTSAGSGSDLPWGVSPDGYRLPPSTALGCVRLQVADLDRSVAWYEEVLGLRASPEGRGMARLTATGASEPLVELYERPGASPVPRNSRLGLFHFAILLPDRPALGRFASHLHEARRRAETPAPSPARGESGRPRSGRPGSERPGSERPGSERSAGVRVGTVGASDHLVSEALYLHDPDGLGVEVYADRPRSSWRHRDSELVMATEPLDMHDLMQAGADSTWEGMPAGTTVGHIHLHVGDLARAQAFYHQGLGLDRTVWSYPGALFLSAGGYHHHLGVNTWAREAVPPEADDARLLEWELIVPSAEEVKAAVASVEAAAPGSGAVTPQPGGVLLHDPWGTALRVRTPSRSDGHVRSDG